MKNITYLIIIAFVFNAKLNAQSGCTDPLATNYSSDASINDGSCTYNTTSISPTASYNLSSTLVETSGLIEWNGSLYTHNDNTDTNIYQISETDGALTKTFSLTGVTNKDWEEISQDADYIYIGDFGNNASGNRTDLKIYKIKKSTLSTVPQIEIINFSYSDQTDFTAKAANSTDFDCESMVVGSDGIYLFTKQWLGKKTSIYKLLKSAGTQKANFITTFNVAGLVTGATFKEDSHLIALCGYSETLSPFIYLIYDFTGSDFAVSNKRKIDVSLPFYQIEGIATSDGLNYFLSNEKFERLPVASNPQKLHKISLNSYLSDYFKNLSVDDFGVQQSKGFLYPNPTDGEIKINSKDNIGQEYKIFDSTGKAIETGILNSNSLSLDNFLKGIYILTLTESKQTYKIIKK